MSIDKWYQSNGHIRVIRYVLIVVAVTLLMAFGVAFSIKSGLGTSPISSVPYVLSLITPFSVGGVTILLNCFLIALQPLILGRLFSPLAFIMGVPTKDVFAAGDLLGIKLAVNEFLAYSQLSNYIASGTLEPKTIMILTYALCGFANLSSVAKLNANIENIKILKTAKKIIDK